MYFYLFYCSCCFLPSWSSMAVAFKSWNSSWSVPIVCTTMIFPPKSSVSQNLYRRPRSRSTPITRYSCGTGSKKWIRSSIRYVTTFPFPCDPTSSSSRSKHSSSAITWKGACAYGVLMYAKFWVSLTYLVTVMLTQLVLCI